LFSTLRQTQSRLETSLHSFGNNSFGLFTKTVKRPAVSCLFTGFLWVAIHFQPKTWSRREMQPTRHYLNLLNKAMGDFSVHRLRIGDWVPSAIKSIAADPFSEKVAVGRENGDIEVIRQLLFHNYT
jgi:hypothetical protein